MEEHQAQYRYADGRGKFCHGVEHCGCQTALVFREPVASSFRVGRKSWRLADPQKKPRSKQRADPAGDGCGEGGYAPNDCADDADSAHAETVKQKAGRKLEQRVAPIIGAGQIAEHHRGNSERVLQRIAGDREVDAIEIIHQHAKAEEHRYAPSASWY